MKWKKRNLGDKITPALVINDGELSVVDGSSVTEYLKSWQEGQSVPDGTFLSVAPIKTIQKLERDSILMNNWAA